MLDIRFEECCSDCNNIDANIFESNFRNRMLGLNTKKVFISCKHSPVCKKYLECDESWRDKNQT